MIRAYTQSDRDAVVKVWYEASFIAHSFLPAEFWDSERDDLKNKYLPTAETWVFEEEGEVVGFISLLGNAIGGLFVMPSSQGKGIGRQLIEYARTMKTNLSLQVFKENIKSRHFYEKCGFITTAESLHTPTGHVLLTMNLVTADTEVI